MAYKVMIVDDDMNFRFALREMIPWEEHGFFVEAEAIHGRQALDILETTQIHVVITDMDMPVMNGVELTAEIVKRYPQMIVVACSAFDDFQFVKESMRLGAADYILKQDFDGEKIIHVIEELVEKQRVRLNREIRKDLIQEELRSFLEGKADCFPSELPENAALSRCRSMTLMLVCNKGNQTTLFMQDDLELLLARRLDTERWIVLVPAVTGRDAYQKSGMIAERIARCFEGTVQVSICDEPGSLDDLPELYKRSARTLDAGMYESRKRVLHDLDFRERFRKRQENFSYTPEEDLPADELCTDLEEKLRKAMPDRETVDRILSLLYYNRRRAQIKSGEEEGRFHEELKAQYFLEDKLSFFKNSMEQIERDAYRGKHPEIGEAVRYIRKNYALDISLSELASYVGLSENYFSNLFKQETGENLTAFINRIRIEKAKQLLETPSVKVYEVAANVGFRNTTYFSTMFRKITGETISEYRARISVNS